MKKIIRENKRNIKAIIRNIIGRDNEDIEQEVYIKVWKSSLGKPNISKLSHWVSKVTSNTCKDFLKSKQYKIEKMKIEDDSIINDIKDSKTPERVLDSKQRQKMILKAVDRLPKKMKDVIVLYEFEDESYDVIAKKLKVPVGTVKSRLYCAREILKKELSELIGD